MYNSYTTKGQLRTPNKHIAGTQTIKKLHCKHIVGTVHET